MNHWYHIDLSSVDTPALLIDRQKVSSNIIKAIDYAGGVERLRPHVKTHKTLEVAQMQMAAGIYKFKCATIAEAEMLGMAGAKDVLIAYQPQGPKVLRVTELIKRFPKTHFSVLLDNSKTANELNKVFKKAGLVIDVFIDVNDGQFRTGIIPRLIPELVTKCTLLAHVSIVGLHCYDGHIRMSSLDERIAKSTKAFKKVRDLRTYLENVLGKSLLMVAGGSPSFWVHAQYHDVDCSPGTWIFWDQRYAEDYQELSFEKAAVVATRVISQLDEYRYCLDLGHKSIASESPLPRVTFILTKKIVQTGHSEEHLTVKTESANALEVGQLLLAYPHHICPTVALYDHLNVIESGEVKQQWKVIARDRKINI